MLFSKHILRRVSCLTLVLVHISFIYFQANYQLSVLRDSGLLFRQALAKQTQEKECVGAPSSESSDTLSKSKLVPVKRFFEHLFILVPAPVSITDICFVPYRFDQYTSPDIIKFSAHTCHERGPPAA